MYAYVELRPTDGIDPLGLVKTGTTQVFFPEGQVMEPAEDDPVVLWILIPLVLRAALERLIDDPAPPTNDEPKYCKAEAEDAKPFGPTIESGLNISPLGQVNHLLRWKFTADAKAWAEDKEDELATQVKAEADAQCPSKICPGAVTSGHEVKWIDDGTYPKPKYTSSPGWLTAGPLETGEAQNLRYWGHAWAQVPRTKCSP
jgi:hypothetical protein